MMMKWNEMMMEKLKVIFTSVLKRMLQKMSYNGILLGFELNCSSAMYDQIDLYIYGFHQNSLDLDIKIGLCGWVGIVEDIFAN